MIYFMFSYVYVRLFLFTCTCRRPQRPGNGIRSGVLDSCQLPNPSPGNQTLVFSISSKSFSSLNHSFSHRLLIFQINIFQSHYLVSFSTKFQKAFLALCRHEERFLLRLWSVSHPLHYNVIDTQKKAFNGLGLGILLTWLTEPTAEVVFGVVQEILHFKQATCDAEAVYPRATLGVARAQNGILT